MKTSTVRRFIKTILISLLSAAHTYSQVPNATDFEAEMPIELVGNQLQFDLIPNRPTDGDYIAFSGVTIDHNTWTITANQIGIPNNAPRDVEINTVKMSSNFSGITLSYQGQMCNPCEFSTTTDYQDIVLHVEGDDSYTFNIIVEMSGTLFVPWLTGLEEYSFPGDTEPAYSSTLTSYSYQTDAFHFSATSIDEVSNPVEIIFSYPNPFNSYTTIELVSSKRNPVDISIYDMVGNRVKLKRVVLNQGSNQVQLGADLESGIYIVQVNTEKGVIQRKIVKE